MYTPTPLSLSSSVHPYAYHCSSVHLYTSLSQQCTPLSLSQVAARQQLATLLIDHGSSVHALDMQQCTPLHLSLPTVYTSLFLPQVAARQQLATLLIDRGSSVHALDMQQFTPIHLSLSLSLSLYHRLQLGSSWPHFLLIEVPLYMPWTCSSVQHYTSLSLSLYHRSQPSSSWLPS